MSHPPAARAREARGRDAAACPPEDEILSFVEGGLDRGTRAGIESHLGDCTPCRRLVSALAREATETPAKTPGADRSAGDLAPGAVVSGKYEILETLGRGGMGIVFLAFHRTLRQRVALKFLLGEHARDAGLVSRFFREARAAAALGSDHVVRVLDADHAPETGEPFVALEYLDGRDLARVLREDGPLPIELAVDCALQAAEALALAHRHGIVHRDVKPANLFLARLPDGSSRLKVLDFGIAKVAAGAAASAGSTDQTAPAMVLGSPRYMAPEQLKDSSSVDARADVWALGVTLFELLSGASPFGGASLIEVCAAIATDPPRSLRGSRAEVPPALEAAIGRCLEKDVDARTADMGALASDLEPFATAEGARAAERARRVTIARTPSRPPASAPGTVSSSTPAPLGEESTIRATSVARSTSRSRPPVTAISIVAALGVGASVAWWVIPRAGVIAPAEPSAARIETLPSAPASAPSTPSDAPSREPSAAASSASAPTEPVASAAASASASAARPRGPQHAGAPPAAPSASARVPSPPAAPASGRAPLHRDGLTDRK